MPTQVFDRYHRMEFAGTLFDPAEGMTEQEHVDDCDINRIMAKFKETGQLPDNVKVGSFGDFADAPSFMEAQNLLITAKEQFAGLPAKVRDRFHNSPMEFLDYIHSDKADAAECEKWGLLNDEAVKRRASEREAAERAAREKIEREAVERHEKKRAEKGSVAKTE